MGVGWQKKVIKGGIIVALCWAISASAQERAANTQIKKEDISEILSYDQERGSMVVKTRNGRKYQLQVTEKQKIEIESNLKAAPAKARPALAKSAQNQTQAQITARTEDVKPEEKKSPWSVMYFGWYIGDNLDQIHAMTGTWNLRHYFSIKYTLQNGIGLALRPRLDTNYVLERGHMVNNVQDTAFEVSKGGLKLPGDIGLALTGRIFAPTSKKSRDEDQHVGLYARAILSKQLNKVVGLKYGIIPIYFIRGTRSIAKFDDIGRVVGDARPSMYLDIGHEFGVSEKLTEKLSLGQAIGLEHMFMYDDPGLGVEGKIATNLDLTIMGVEYAFSPNFTVTGILGQSHPISEEGKGVALFDPERSNYQVQLTLLF